ncbi:MAG: polyprenyl synthetase family protein, partial [Chloroflexi bacterium]|nr:polyprenyl synthetase family protein [Chloroflexota bacterium]
MQAPLRLIPLLEPLRPELEQVDRLLDGIAAEADQPLQSMLGHVLGGGKRLRAALVILVGQVFAAGGAPHQRLAAAVECLHTATLVHDDIVDEAGLRRGRQTLHTLWSTGTALLVGDYLLACSVALLASLDSPRLLGLLAQMLRTIAAGEIREILGSQPA